jgi:choline dehydrogenase-like flavoprotein
MESIIDYYADPTSGSWAEIGYDPFPLGVPGEIPEVEAPPSRDLDAVDDYYDFVIVGSGAGGGVAAYVLASAGATVLVVERGRWLGRAEIPLDHIRNHRVFFGGDLTSPPGHPRAVLANGGETAVDVDDMRYQHNAITAGGGTRVFGAQAWRFHPDDFRMASVYGVPEGSALADWPIGYDDLEPYYDRVEWELGVCGSPHDGDPPRRRGYPMPPFERGPWGRRLAKAADELGWATGPVPFLINSIPYEGRPACVRCGVCVGFPCPVEAKNGTYNTVLPKAFDLGAHAIFTAQATRVSDAGDVEIAAAKRTRTIRCGKVVLAGGAVETARLLLLSGLGNNWVGDCLQGHTYTFAGGTFDEVVADSVGPGPSTATRVFSHGNEQVIGGGMLADDFVKIPVMFYLMGLAPDVDRNDPDIRRIMAHNYLRTGQVMGPVQEVPTRRARVRLATSVSDACGVKVARLEGEQHPEDLRTAAFMADRAEEWIRATGATRTWRLAPTTPQLSASQHQAGTVRMSDRPDRGATDPFGRVWGCERIIVADSSVHVTNGGVNPVLTIMALAWRTAEHAASKG